LFQPRCPRAASIIVVYRRTMCSLIFTQPKTQSMTLRFLSFILILLLSGALSVSCSENIPDCPSRMCVMAGGWQLTEVFIDDQIYGSDLSVYRLTLNMPSPAEASTSSFHRVNTSGTSDDGLWSLQNNDGILRLIPENDPLLKEDWIIESMSPRKMVLILNRNVGIKEGPAKIEFILEPF
jgi:hypothetical protein